VSLETSAYRPQRAIRTLTRETAFPDCGNCALQLYESTTTTTIRALGNQRAEFGKEPYMVHDSAWSEKLLLVVISLLILVAVAQIALKYVR
jgi:hypothetical protein